MSARKLRSVARLVAQLFLMLLVIAICLSAIGGMFYLMYSQLDLSMPDFTQLQKDWQEFTAGVSDAYREFRALPSEVQIPSLAGGACGLVFMICAFLRTRRQARAGERGKAMKRLGIHTLLGFAGMLAAIGLAFVPYGMAPAVFLSVLCTFVWETSLAMLVFEALDAIGERIGFRSKRKPDQKA